MAGKRRLVDIQSFIAARRDGRQHTRQELIEFARLVGKGDVPDYQASAWLMAAYLKPLNASETAWLTDGMARSGGRIDLTGLPKPWVDKHSTGGIGDKTTLVLLPLLASCGLTMVKMSGGGLGMTGGTIDKLSSIPGFDTSLTPKQMKAQARRIGLALTGQTPSLAPADKVLYALRDATETVSSIPLIVSSVLSKKIAGGADVIVLDVKCGSGAFMETEARARELAEGMMSVAKKLGLNVRISITDMTEPLGSAVGNALEVREAIRVVRNDPLTAEEQRFRSLVLALAAHTLLAAGVAVSRDEGMAKAQAALAGGLAERKMREWFAAQGATADVISNTDLLPKAKVVLPVHYSGESGWISKVAARTVGEAVMKLGGGRTNKDDPIDLSVGVCLNCQIGSQIEEGRQLFEVHAADGDAAQEAASAVLSGISVVGRPVSEPPLLIGEY
jgi:pyrimidine-nucleoside phosphorylase